MKNLRKELEEKYTDYILIGKRKDGVIDFDTFGNNIGDMVTELGIADIQCRLWLLDISLLPFGFSNDNDYKEFLTHIKKAKLARYHNNAEGKIPAVRVLSARSVNNS